jgi:hypothetical protein
MPSVACVPCFARHTQRRLHIIVTASLASCVLLAMAALGLSD